MHDSLYIYNLIDVGSIQATYLLSVVLINLLSTKSMFQSLIHGILKLKRTISIYYQKMTYVVVEILNINTRWTIC